MALHLLTVREVQTAPEGDLSDGAGLMLRVRGASVIFHKHCSSNPAAAIRRKMRETLPAKKAGKFAALPYRELPAFMHRLREQQGTAARCLEFAVHTAARTNEVLSMLWSEVDLETGEWLVPASKMKAKEDHLVYLSPQAIDLLKARKALWLDPAIVFPSVTLEHQPMSNMAMLAVLDRMGVRDRTTVHGLCRATFSTWAYDTAAARPDVIEVCLAHREADKVKAAYNRAQFTEERRALMCAWAEHLARSVSNVVSMRVAR